MPPPRSKNFFIKNSGFTLAEVLITLGVIGVVAALTLPSVVANYQKEATVAKLKKTYSVVNQAILQSIVENDDYSNWEKPNDANTNNAFFEKYWLPYFKGAVVCTWRNLCGYGSRATLSSTFYRLNESSSGISGKPITLTAIGFTDRSTIMLPDGSVVIYFNGYNNSAIPASWILIDINGGQKPNTYGKDVFLFDRNNKGMLVPRCNNFTTEQINKDCSNKGSGECCAARIINNGWKIDY